MTKFEVCFCNPEDTSDRLDFPEHAGVFEIEAESPEEAFLNAKEKWLSESAKAGLVDGIVRLPGVSRHAFFPSWGIEESLVGGMRSRSVCRSTMY